MGDTLAMHLRILQRRYPSPYLENRGISAANRLSTDRSMDQRPKPATTHGNPGFFRYLDESDCTPPSPRPNHSRCPNRRALPRPWRRRTGNKRSRFPTIQANELPRRKQRGIKTAPIDGPHAVSHSLFLDSSRNYLSFPHHHVFPPYLQSIHRSKTHLPIVASSLAGNA